MRFLAKGVLGATLALASVPASAVSIINVTGPQAVTIQTLSAGANLTNFSLDGVLYLFDEGISNGRRSFLLHYLRTGGNQAQYNSGSFDILLAAGETFVTPYASTQATLNATDKAGVTYATTDVNRGLDNASAIFFGDTVSAGSPNPIHVTYALSTSTGGLFTGGTDEVRFFIDAAPLPEPASWALMIVGMGAIGATLRYRRKSPTHVASFA